MQFITEAPERFRPDAARPTRKSGSTGAPAGRGRGQLQTHIGRSHINTANDVSVATGRPSLKRSLDDMTPQLSVPQRTARPALYVPAAARTLAIPVRQHSHIFQDPPAILPSARPMAPPRAAISSLISRPAFHDLPRPGAGNPSSKWATFLDDADDALDISD